MFVYLAVISVLLGVISAINIRWAKLFSRMMMEPAEHLQTEELPPVLVLLPMRGADPFLSLCLSNLANQDYSNYRVHIIVDHPDDPANRDVQVFLESYEQDLFDVSYLEQPLSTCSLKVSAINQVLGQVGQSYEFIVFLDADVVAHPSWLRELVTPLINDEELAATTGMRWFIPEKRSLANLIRRQWNTAAIAQMYLFDIPWGGSLAIRRSFIEEEDVLKHWTQCLCEDTPLPTVLNRSKKALAYVPDIIMINRESTSLSSAIQFIGRQLLFAQLYHPRWLSVQLPGLVNGILPLLAWAGLLISVIQTGRFGLMEGITSLCIILHGVSFLFQELIVISRINSRLRSRGEEVENSILDFKTFLEALATLCINFWGVIRPSWIKEINWRGITYRRIRGNQFELVEYKPYREQAQSLETDLSI